MAVEKLTFRAHAHGVKPQQDFLQKLRRVELVFGFVVALVLGFNQGIEVGQNGVVRGGKALEIGAVADSELFVQLAQHDFNGVNVAVGKIFVAPEEILEKADVLTELGGLAECLGCVGVLRAAALVPCFRLQRVDPVPARHEINETAAEVFRQLHIFVLWIKAQNRLARFEDIAENEL
ncbi:hypothetical protein SDC9_90089 [bioreactor metagenome]|uniref:Uncharacterized protein n=1 Tax=bioreactor metagenome TaxID=1076179 RepID=A0A644ZRM6_9ZZZZ